jgi:hypothetical protein
MNFNGGSGNTANGYDSLIYNHGSYNTANGYEALGGSSLLFAPTGGGNTGDGAFALLHNSTGSNNVANGANALSANTTGTNNVAVGYNAGLAITGNNNIDIGNLGVGSDSGIIRIGTPGAQTQTYLAGTVNCGVISSSGSITSSGNIIGGTIFSFGTIFSVGNMTSLGNITSDGTITSSGLISGGLNVDSTGQNDGNIHTNALTFGTGSNGSGEGIASQRTSGPNQFDLALYTGFNPRLTVLASGNVGIGMTAPVAQLDVTIPRVQASLSMDLPHPATVFPESV